MARIAALVVGYRSSEEIAGLVESLRRVSGKGSHTVEIHVIDNSGDPDEVAQLEAIPDLAALVPSGVNLGYGGGMNALAASLTGEYDWYLVCNPDIRFTDGAIDALIAAGESHPTSALFGPRIIGSDGLVYPSARAFPSIRTGVGHALFVGVWPGNPWTRRYHRGTGDSDVADTEVDWVSGACILVRPSAFAEVEGFDEGYFMYFEDVDLAYRLAKRGWKAMLVRNAIIVHSGAHSTSSQADFMRKVHHKSAERYLSNKYTGWYLAPLRVSLRLGLAVRSRWYRG